MLVVAWVPMTISWLRCLFFFYDSAVESEILCFDAPSTDLSVQDCFDYLGSLEFLYEF